MDIDAPTLPDQWPFPTGVPVPPVRPETKPKQKRKRKAAKKKPMTNDALI